MKARIHKLLIVLMFLPLICSSGCNIVENRQQAIQNRWNNVLNQARMNYVRESLDAGNYEHAEYMLQVCLKDNPDMPEAVAIMDVIEKLHIQNAETTVAIVPNIRH